MATLPVYDSTGTRTGEMEAPAAVFTDTPNAAVLHQVVLAQLAADRQGNASTKTRSEVRGSNRKLWRQKGTGRARVGDARAPSREGGGVAMGPRPRSHRQRLSREMKRAGLRSALGARAAEGAVTVVESIALPEAKTRALRQVLEALEAEGRVLLVLGEPDESVLRSGRNIPGLSIASAVDLNAYQVITARKAIMTKEAVARLEARLS